MMQMRNDNEREIDDEQPMPTILIEKRQIDMSNGLFEAMIRQTNNEIDKIKRGNERKEKDRRFAEEVKRQERYEEIQKEAMLTARKNAELEMRWSEFREMTECQELAVNINEHKKMFQELINKKKVLIDKMWRHIREKDSEFSKEIENQKFEIDAIVSNMRKQFVDLRSLISSELKAIEIDLILQRKKMIESKVSEINEKFKSHEENENNSARKR